MGDSAKVGSDPVGSEDEGLRRVLGPVDATCVVVGAIVGVGIFFQPSAVANAAGSGGLALLAWAIGGGIALLGALCFAELGGMYRRSGGQYEILRDSYGPMTAFLFVFCNATAVQAGAMAIIAIICAQNLAGAVGVDDLEGTVLFAMSAGLIASLAVANVLGVKQGARVQNVTVFAKVGVLVLIGVLAMLYGEHSITGPVELPVEAGAEAATGAAADAAAGSGTADVTAPPAGASPSLWACLFAALVPTLFAFGGWQHGLWIAGEVRDPARTMPRAIVGGIAIVIFVYLLANAAYLWLLGPSGVASSKLLAADAVSQVWASGGRRAIAAAVAFSAYGVLNAQLLSGPRLIFAMSKDGRFFPRFGGVHPITRAPAPAILLLGGLALALLLATFGAYWLGWTESSADGVGQLTTGVVCIDSVFFVATGVALFVLRRRRPGTERPVRVPLFPLVPALFVLGEVAVVIGAFADPAKLSASLIGVVWIGAALAIYLWRFRPAS